MTRILTAAQVYGAAVAGGFRGQDAVIATAITMPEASANADAIQQGQPYATTGWGLWQITPGDSEPWIGIDYQLLDPYVNARAAFAKYHQAGYRFSPWTTYWNGAYRRWLGWAQDGANEFNGGGGGEKGPISGSGNPDWDHANQAWGSTQWEYQPRMDDLNRTIWSTVNTAYTLR